MQSSSLRVYPHRYDMRVFQRKVFMYYLVQHSTLSSFSIQTDVKQVTINLSNLVQQHIITTQIKTDLQSKAKRYQISTYKRQTFVSIRFLLEYIKKMNYKEWVIKAIEQIQTDLYSRTKLLTMESIKRNREFEKKNNIVINDREEQVKHLKSKLNYLFDKDYDIDTSESVDQLYQRMRNGSSNLPLQVLKMSVFDQQKMNTILNRYQRQFQQLSSFQGRSSPTNLRLPKQYTSLYIVHTDLQATFDGKTYNVIKVGKTDLSIFTYESCLYQDYKAKLLFKHVFLGIFEKVPGEGDIDKYFHERLVMIPKSRYFIFNYHDAEEETRVSQEFYLLTDQFIEKMDQFLKDFCKTHKHIKQVRV